MRPEKTLRSIPALLLAAAITAMPAAAQSETVKGEAIASYYGDEFNGQPTSSGEVFDMNAFTAAHRTLPFGTMLEVTNLANGNKTVVRVNDRGPFVENRELDVSKAAAARLGMLGSGTARVSIRKIAVSDTVAAAPETPKTVTAETVSRQVSSATFAAEAPLDGENGASAGTASYAAQTAAGGPEARRASVPERPANADVTTVAAPKLADSSTGEQWRIQLGSFSREENANRLVARLRKDGFNPAFEKTGALTRVVLAGIADRELKTVRARLDSAGYGNYLVRQEAW